MNSREKILGTIAASQPEQVSLPVIEWNQLISYDDVYAQFKTVLESMGGKVELIDTGVLREMVKNDRARGSFIINTISTLGIVDEHVSLLSALQLEKLETVYIKGTLGVAENGAVWLYESQMLNRLLPFICQHLILVIGKKNILPTMHHAYRRIDVAREGFGVFIAGPSKTADIEQSLVVGAHGARSTTIYILNEN